MNWSDTACVRSLLDGDVVNAGIAQFRHFSSRHLQPVAVAEPAPGSVLLETVTGQTRIRIAMTARTRVHTAGKTLDVPARLIGDHRLTAGHELELMLSTGVPVTVEKIVTVATSRDRAISTPAEAVRLHQQRAADFATLLTAQERAWGALWDDFAIPVGAAAQPGLALHLHTFHVLQTVSGASRDLDVGIGARGLHGYTIVQYYQASADIGFLAEMGGELLIEICRFFAALPSYDPDEDRFHIDGAMGPDEFHDGYPGHAGSGLRDNAYTNVLLAWLLHRTGDLLRRIDGSDCGRLRRRLAVTPAETARWELLSRRLAVPLHADGVISQFEGYERLPELDWDTYRARYPNLGRLDLILDTEGDSTNNYRVSKQADVLMLFYLLSAEELREVLARLGYPLSPETVQATVDFYTRRTSHGSTLSRVVYAWVNARADRHRAWSIFTEALRSDLADTQGGTTREGVHLGAMAGTVDLVLRCFAGIETRDDALGLHPVLPPEMGRVEFTVVYCGQQVRVELTPRLVRLRLRPCQAEPITVWVEDDRTVLRPGDVYETSLPARPTRT